MAAQEHCRTIVDGMQCPFSPTQEVESIATVWFTGVLPGQHSSWACTPPASRALTSLRTHSDFWLGVSCLWVSLA